MTTVRLLVFLFLLVFSTSAHAATYYISPTGSNANAGTSAGSPWLTFAYAINVARASCGDTLILANGTYGNTTSTGNLLVSGLVCTLGDELTIRAQNSRQAKILDNGTGQSARTTNSAYIIFDGLYARSVDNSGATTSGQGEPFRVHGSNHIQIKNSMGVNSNRYANSHVVDVISSQDILVEDFEGYIYHRHCTMGFTSERMVVRRTYCNPRGGKISGGFGTPVGSGDALFSMYPCKGCILENGIFDGTTNPGYISELNANFNGGILLSGSRVLGSIGYKANYGNGIYLASRTAADLNHTPQSITIRDIALIDWASASSGIRVSDGVGIVVDHITVLSTGSAGNGISTDDPASTGVGTASNSIAITNALVAGVTPGRGFHITGFTTWTGDEVISNGNGTAFSPPTPSNWTNTATGAHSMGTCKAWVPTGALGKGAGTGGSDIGATLLYRYVDGVLTTTPLWDTTTGAFPYGADDPDGVNRVAGQSLFDFHTRININTGGCPFPAGYGGGGGSTTVVKGTTAASGLSTTATPLIWNHTIAASQDRLLACIVLRDIAGSVGSVSGVDVSGQAMTLVRRETTTPAHRAAELWSLAAPTSGVRTITATLIGAISGALGRSTEFDVTSGLNTAVGVAANTGSTLSVTAPTNSNELVVDCTVSSNSSTYTHGTDQTGETDLSHASVSLLLALSTQNGSNGGVMSNSTGSSVYQAKVAVSLIAGTPDPPSTATLTQGDFLFIYPSGTEAGAPPIAYWLSDVNAKNLPISSRTNGYVRVRAMITGSVATTSPFGVALFCRKNAESYTKAVDTFGSTIFRLYGPGITPDIPSSLTNTSNRLCSANCITGAVLRDQSSTFVVPALAVGEKIELDSVVVFQATAGDTVNCRYQNDNGTALDTYSNTPLITFTEDASGAP